MPFLQHMSCIGSNTRLPASPTENRATPHAHAMPILSLLVLANGASRPTARALTSRHLPMPQIDASSPPCASRPLGGVPLVGACCRAMLCCRAILQERAPGPDRPKAWGAHASREIAKRRTAVEALAVGTLLLVRLSSSSCPPRLLIHVPHPWALPVGTAHDARLYPGTAHAHSVDETNAERRP